MAVCGNCGKHYGDSMGFCPFCGDATPPPETETRKDAEKAEETEEDSGEESKR